MAGMASRRKCDDKVRGSKHGSMEVPSLRRRSGCSGCKSILFNRSFVIRFHTFVYLAQNISTCCNPTPDLIAPDHVARTQDYLPSHEESELNRISLWT
jgi:hypothetical protein